MHSEIITVPEVVTQYARPFVTLCLYDGIKWELYLEAQQRGRYADPGYLFEICLN